MRFVAILVFLVGCGSEGAAPPPALASVAAPPARPQRVKSPEEKTVLDVALESPDHTTLVAAVKATDLVSALASPGGIYTVFAPTNAAFAELPAGTLDELLKPERKADLKAIVRHHAMVPVIEQSAMTDGQVLEMSDGTSVTVHVADGVIHIGEASILGEVRARNGVVYVVDKVLLPPSP